MSQFAHDTCLWAVKAGLLQHNVKQDSLHGIESALLAEVLVFHDPTVDCKEDSKVASREGSQQFVKEPSAMHKEQQQHT